MLVISYRIIIIETSAKDEAVETSFRFIPNGKNIKNRHFTFTLMFFEKRDDTASVILKKMVNFKPELNLESITPKNFDFTHPRVSPFVALEITQESVHIKK